MNINELQAEIRVKTVRHFHWNLYFVIVVLCIAQTRMGCAAKHTQAENRQVQTALRNRIERLEAKP